MPTSKSSSLPAAAISDWARVKTSPTDFYPIEREQLARFDGKTWVLFGRVYDPSGN